ncbi:MAG: sulfatase-like hydrolase/transferase [Planctomycetales bacterium]|nr:sulfatase-like hydrolase/transferase [Planctomycetales bacterium]
MNLKSRGLSVVRRVLGAGCLGIAVLSVATDRAVATSPAGSRPNIVFLLADDMGWAQPGFNGGNPDLTPHLDRLAGESLRLSQFYTHSVCSPTRAALLTGRYAFRTWMDWRTEDFGKPSYLAKLGLTLAHNERGEPTRRIHALDTRERTIAEALRDAGYYTAIVGKWHCGEWLPEHLPMGQGFAHQYGHYAWGIDYFTKTIVHNAPARFAVYDWHRNQKPLREEGYSTDLFAAEAERVIASQAKERPFFLYVPFNAVHGPLNAPPRYAGLDVRDAMLKCLDDAVGRIVESLEQHGFAENTLLVFTNDNGPVLESMSKPFRGNKNTTFEGGVRQPCLVRWPGNTRAGAANDGMMFVADWYTTFITLAGGEHEQEFPVDGLDMTEMLFAGKPSPRQEIIFEVEGSVRLPTVRHGDYKLMGDLLFDIRNDPGETTDIAAEHPDVARRLKARLAAVAQERPSLGDKPLLMDPPLPYIYGQAENKDPPPWLVEAVEKVRETQPKEWAPGETPWPQAPKTP